MGEGWPVGASGKWFDVPGHLGGSKTTRAHIQILCPQPVIIPALLPLGLLMEDITVHLSLRGHLFTSGSPGPGQDLTLGASVPPPSSLLSES